MTRSSLLDDAIIESQFSGAALAQNAKNIDATPTILVADDDDDIRGLITFKLQMAGYRVLTADNGNTALSLIKAQLPDAVVLDIGMPGIDGFGVCWQLQALRTIVDIPVIIVSARTSENDISLGYTIGADEYLIKPFSPADLVRRVRRLLLANDQ
jgi:DNA-binding response OmpR family regulator